MRAVFGEVSRLQKLPEEELFAAELLQTRGW
jgi:hypothetical protein